jgi:hypothetical protein
MAQDTQWSRLGWQGIALDVPADWCPGRLTGDFASGYLRVEDEWRVRLELRWETLRPPLPAASQLVDRFLDQCQRKLRRNDPQPQIARDRSVPGLDALDHEVFTWRGGFAAHSLMAVCPATHRAVHVRVFVEAGDELKELTRRVFASLVTAPREDLCEWSVFDLRCQVPASWQLTSSALRTGCLQLAFRHGRDELEVSRFSLAELSLRKATLSQWFGRTFAKPLRGIHLETREDRYRDHAALRCQGLSRTRGRPLGFLRRPRHLTALAWHCQAADRFFVVRLVAANANDTRVRSVADTVLCH